MVNPSQILDFWLTAGPGVWWSKNAKIDQQIVENFSEAHEAAATGKLTEWEAGADGALALIILLDQFSRNMFRGNAKSFSQDTLAKKIAEKSIAKGFDQQVNEELRSFFYMPFMHSESILDQDRCLIHMHRQDGAESLDAAITHRRIIARFGRFPHRNTVLGRHTTLAEQQFLDGGGFKG